MNNPQTLAFNLPAVWVNDFIKVVFSSSFPLQKCGRTLFVYVTHTFSKYLCAFTLNLCENK